jgi:hypothetical protein
MSPEQLAESLPERFKDFDIYVEYGHRQGKPTAGLWAYNDDLHGWIAGEFGELPEDLVNEARALPKCTVADWYRYAMSRQAPDNL